jgi:hypothetical protein
MITGTTSFCKAFHFMSVLAYLINKLTTALWKSFIIFGLVFLCMPKFFIAADISHDKKEGQAGEEKTGELENKL